MLAVLTLTTAVNANWLIGDIIKTKTVGEKKVNYLSLYPILFLGFVIQRIKCITFNLGLLILFIV